MRRSAPQRHWPGKNVFQEESSSESDVSDEQVTSPPDAVVRSPEALTISKRPRGDDDTAKDKPREVRGGIISRVEARSARIAKDNFSPDEDNGEGSDSTSSSEGSTSGSSSAGEEEQAAPMTLMKPLFVSKQHRSTIEEQRVQAEAQDEEKKRVRDDQNAVRLQTTRDLVATGGIVQPTQHREKTAAELAAALVDDEDHDSEADEDFEKWTMRELERLRRDRTLAVQRTKSTEHIQEGKREARKPQEEPVDRSKMTYMQKYYHRGAFFMEKDETGKAAEDIYNRDFAKATDGEQFDKRLLPKPMQLRRGQVGISGRSKYTTMADQDTSRGGQGVMLAKKTERSSFRLGNNADPFARPRGKAVNDKK